MNNNHPAHPDWVCILDPNDDARDPQYVPQEYIKDVQKSLYDNDADDYNKENKNGSKH